MTRIDLPPAGHAPGQFRDALIEVLWTSRHLGLLEEAVFPGQHRQAALNLYEKARRQRLIHKLWNCTDIVPGHVCEDLGLAPGSTYAQLVQRLRHVAAPELEGQ